MDEEWPMLNLFRKHRPERGETGGGVKSIVILVCISTASLAVMVSITSLLFLMDNGAMEVISSDARTGMDLREQPQNVSSPVRSPGFSVYDLPLQVCTDVAYCCMTINSSGHLAVHKNVLEFIRILRSGWPAQNRLYLALGGHRLLVQSLDAALENTAILADILTDTVRSVRADGLAIYIQDLKPLRQAHRVHDLIMSIQGIWLAVVLPQDIRQQVRYFRSEVYVNMRGLTVIVPPSRVFWDARPTFATCPEPRRSRQTEASLEFDLQLSKALLSPDVGAVYGGQDDGGQRPRLLLALSLGGFKFLLRNQSQHDVGSPAVFVRKVSYLDICRAPWMRWHDAESDCIVAWDGGRAWMSSLGPGSGAFLAQSRQRGIALFDIDFDDFRGQCGSKFPVLRALRAVINGWKESEQIKV
ncbi:unnamed protein product [Ixodes pacificus]